MFTWVKNVFLVFCLLIVDSMANVEYCAKRMVTNYWLNGKLHTSVSTSQRNRASVTAKVSSHHIVILRDSADLSPRSVLTENHKRHHTRCQKRNSDKSRPTLQKEPWSSLLLSVWSLLQSHVLLKDTRTEQAPVRYDNKSSTPVEQA